jgi:hypothetical protein
MLNIIILSLSFYPNPFAATVSHVEAPVLECVKPSWAFGAMPWLDNAPNNDYNSPFQEE